MYIVEKWMAIPSCLKLVIFDLDDTLHYHSINYMPKHIIDILKFFKSYNVRIAMASLNTRAYDYVYHYKIDKYFSSIELRKEKWNVSSRSEREENTLLTKHYMFCRLLKRFGCEPREVLFFDDSNQHIYTAQSLGIHCVKVDPAFCIRWKDVIKGLEKVRPYPTRRRSADF